MLLNEPNIHSASIDGDRAKFLSDVLAGLSAPTRSLPSKYFYDQRGSSLFDRICELDVYYPTRVEADITCRFASEIADRLGPEIRLIEYGSGSSVKTRVLLDHLIDPRAYVPVDISGEHLLRTAECLGAEYPLLEVSPVVADFTKQFALPEADFGTARSCIYFPGSTIGNLTPASATDLCASMAEVCGDEGGLLIGFDLQKDVAVLEAAYDDQAGVTAEFNKNLLRRINRELDGDFDMDRFEHLAFYNRAAGRIEMHLASRCEHQVIIAGHRFEIGWGETILTEYSHKYTVDGFEAMAAQAGWSCRDVWTDERNYFAVMYLEREAIRRFESPAAEFPAAEFPAAEFPAAESTHG